MNGGAHGTKAHDSAWRAETCAIARGVQCSLPPCCQAFAPSIPVYVHAGDRWMTTACLVLVLHLGTALGSLASCNAAVTRDQGGSCADGDGSGCRWACRFIFTDRESLSQCTASCNSRTENGLYGSYNNGERVGCRATCASWESSPPAPPSKAVP